MEPYPPLCNGVRAAVVLGCSQELLFKAVKDGRIQCAWLFNPDGLLVRRVRGGGNSQGCSLHFFEDELATWYRFTQRHLREMPVDETAGFVPEEQDRPMIYSSGGAAKRLEISKGYLRELVTQGRILAYYYNPSGTLTQCLPSRETSGRGAIFFGPDLQDVRRRPVGRPRMMPERRFRMPSSDWRDFRLG